MTPTVSEVIAAYEALDARIDRGEPRGHGNEAFGALSKLLTELGLDRAAHPTKSTSPSSRKRSARYSPR
jgi:hypothetical protein